MDFEYLKEKLPTISDPNLLAAMLKEGQLINFEGGKGIMEPGKYVKMVPIVLEGAIKVLRQGEDGKELFLYYLDPGETCALSLTCCTASRPSEVRAVAEEKTLVLAIPIQFHEIWLEKYKQWKEFVNLTYQHRFQELLSTLDAVAFKKMDERLMDYIIKKMRQYKSTELYTTHQEIALELGTSREVVSRLLKQLEKRKWIELGRNVIFIREDFEELAGKP
ncbi:Crp/Fnr family transcriptional regulator [Pleomorphovibrio marinus]|uniref:Crp/Fnr family transcriptional regulator n=1 Tax=Pleomorphovibrio marinus TaxID=2164132 RepID=UPI000E0B0E52|nr:Crp/Fnr family transcriptional regulator [Pleomorphovibrio marinus]